jgi:hypothetical protein
MFYRKCLVRGEKVRSLKSQSLWLLTVAAFYIVTGCGGGGGGSNQGGNPGPGPTPSPVTRVVLNVVWPERSRAVTALSSALSLVVTMPGANQDGTDFTWTINRDAATAGVATRYVSTTIAKVGTYPVGMKLFAEANGAGTQVGAAGGTAVLAADGSGIPDLVFDGVIQTVEVPQDQNVPRGAKKDLIFSAKDANGNIVAVTYPSATWQVTSGGDLLRFVQGQAEYIADGDATVTATVDGKTSAPARIVLGPNSGSVVVSVKDPFGSLLPAVQITLTKNGTQVGQVTSATGQETMTAPFGSLVVSAAKAGYIGAQTTVDVTRTGPATAELTLQAEGVPSASTGGVRIIDRNGNQVTFEVDVSVLDANGNPLQGLDASVFNIPALTEGGVNYSFARVSVTPISVPYQGPYSAFIALDQSGSVTSTDPNVSRLQAAKIFFSALANGDEAALGYFPSANNTPSLFKFPRGFVTDGTQYYPDIDSLNAAGFVSTPLFIATIQAIDETDAKAVNRDRKAVVVFTDGKPFGDTATLAQVVSAAQAKGVKVHAVGLGIEPDMALLAQMAQRTGGTTMHATEAGQLVTFYKSLGALLGGAGTFYRTRWTVTRDPGVFEAGQAINGAAVHVALPGRTLVVPFYLPIQ